MNIDMLRQNGWIIYEVITGSHAYGTNVEGSDKDRRGVFIMPTKDVLGTTYYPQVGDEKHDTVFYEIGRFLELAMKGNPNILEILNSNDDMVIYKSPVWDEIFSVEVKQKFLTKKLRHTLIGYAHSQIHKATGLDKLMNWEDSRVERKDVLDFCYVLKRCSDSVLFKQWEKERHKIYPGGYVMENWAGIMVPVERVVVPDRSLIGLANVNNFPDLYAAYYIESGGGIISESSNDVQLRSIPKDAPFLFYLRFNKTAYSQHCRDYKQYTTWLKERNTQRYVDSVTHGQRIDGKNLLHLVRLLNMGKDVAQGNGIVVRRPEAEYLKSIRRGEVDLQTIIDQSDSMIDEVRKLFDESLLPAEVDPNFVNELLIKIRLQNLEA